MTDKRRPFAFARAVVSKGWQVVFHNGETLGGFFWPKETAIRLAEIADVAGAKREQEVRNTTLLECSLLASLVSMDAAKGLNEGPYKNGVEAGIEEFLTRLHDENPWMKEAIRAMAKEGK